ncbi:hypothetical protein L9F63_013043, partial [Diploptera punctata]
MVSLLRKKLVLRLSIIDLISYIAKINLHTSLIRCEAEVVNGREIAKSIISETKKELKEWIERGHKKPALSVIRCGTNERDYTKSIVKSCKDIGINVHGVELPKDISEIELLTEIRKMNNDLEIDAIMLELPFPSNVRERIMCNAVAPHKDVNGYNIINVGRLLQQKSTILPCMPAAIKEIISRIGVPTAGKTIVVCGRSQKIGLPIAILACLEDKGEVVGMNATIIVCHDTTPKEQLAQLVKQADILISACGTPGLIEPTMLKEGACVIDVGSVVLEDEKTQKYKLIGDINFE